MKLIRGIVLMAATMALVACGGDPPRSAGTTPAPVETKRDQAIAAAADTTAVILDAIGTAPPASINKTTIDDKAIRLAFQTFDHALTLIDVAIEVGAIKPGSPRALSIRDAVLKTQAALNAASQAQRASSATSYRAALERARDAFAFVQLGLAKR